MKKRFYIAFSSKKYIMSYVIIDTKEKINTTTGLMNIIKSIEENTKNTNIIIVNWKKLKG